MTIDVLVSVSLDSKAVFGSKGAVINF